jgi:cytochrome oxidase Cu insertion factor (SCO1/SenC/PrrC family)
MGRATDEIAVSVEVQGRGSDPEEPPEEDPTDEETAGERPVVDRAAAFAENAPPIPRKFVYWVVAGFAVLGLGGLGLEHLFSAAGLNPTAAAHHSSATTTTTTTTPAASTPPPPGQQTQIGASLASLMDLSRVPATAAPPIDLIDQSGQPYSLSATKATVLTFFDGSCDDICSVLAAEIVQADTDLGAEAAHVEFVTVNTDPSALSVSGLAGAEAASTLSALPNWVMLTGPLSTMDAVWRSYGITITVVQKTGVEAHNNFAYFIDPQGQELYRATPFADESRSGTYSLPATEIDQWATGLAAYAVKVIAP